MDDAGLSARHEIYEFAGASSLGKTGYGGRWFISTLFEDLTFLISQVAEKHALRACACKAEGLRKLTFCGIGKRVFNNYTKGSGFTNTGSKRERESAAWFRSSALAGTGPWAAGGAVYRMTSAVRPVGVSREAKLMDTTAKRSGCPYRGLMSSGFALCRVIPLGFLVAAVEVGATPATIAVPRVQRLRRMPP